MEFLKYKMDNFGEYEDATIENHPFLFHSVITPMLNIGLLTDKIIIKKVLKHKSRVDETLKMSSINESQTLNTFDQPSGLTMQEESQFYVMLNDVPQLQ